MQSNTEVTACRHLAKPAVSAVCFLAAVLLASTTPDSLDAKVQGQAVKKHAQVFIHSQLLGAEDTLLTHGKNSKPIELKPNTTLIWVDQHPNVRFGHSTEYILVSPAGTEVVKGSWWPILNGKDLFRDGKTNKVEFPLALNSHHKLGS